MNFDEIENLSEEQINELYFDLSEKDNFISWQCACNTVNADSNCKCLNSVNNQSSQCVFEQGYEWFGTYNDLYLFQQCTNWCNYTCGSNCVAAVDTNSGHGDGDWSIMSVTCITR